MQHSRGIGPLRQPATKQQSTKAMRTAPSAGTLSRASRKSLDTEYVITYQERLVYTVSIMEFGNSR